MSIFIFHVSFKMIEVCLYRKIEINQFNLNIYFTIFMCVLYSTVIKCDVFSFIFLFAIMFYKNTEQSFRSF